MRLRNYLSRWGYAWLLMAAIFALSSVPGRDMPDFRWADLLVKKGGHALGYGLLALSYWRGFGLRSHMAVPAWLLACAFALTDEAHQSLTPGRFASPLDVLIDAAGAAGALLLLRGRLAIDRK